MTCLLLEIDVPCCLDLCFLFETLYSCSQPCAVLALLVCTSCGHISPNTLHAHQSIATVKLTYLLTHTFIRQQDPELRCRWQCMQTRAIFSTGYAARGLTDTCRLLMAAPNRPCRHHCQSAHALQHREV
jgi:hypothetical protein